MGRRRSRRQAGQPTTNGLGNWLGFPSKCGRWSSPHWSNAEPDAQSDGVSMGVFTGQIPGSSGVFVGRDYPLHVGQTFATAMLRLRSQHLHRIDIYDPGKAVRGLEAGSGPADEVPQGLPVGPVHLEMPAEAFP